VEHDPNVGWRKSACGQQQQQQPPTHESSRVAPVLPVL